MESLSSGVKLPSGWKARPSGALSVSTGPTDDIPMVQIVVYN